MYPAEFAPPVGRTGRSGRGGSETELLSDAASQTVSSWSGLKLKTCGRHNVAEHKPRTALREWYRGPRGARLNMPSCCVPRLIKEYWWRLVWRSGSAAGSVLIIQRISISSVWNSSFPSAQAAVDFCSIWIVIITCFLMIHHTFLIGF